MGTLIAGSSIQTVKHPELSPKTPDLPLDLADLIAVWITSESKLRKVPLSELNTFFATGGGSGGHAPVTYLGEMIYKVPAGAVGGQIASIPSLAGKDFTLERGGLPLEPLLEDESNIATAEYEILDAGGFQLLQAGDVLGLGERFKLTIYSLIGTTGPGPATPASSFIGGKKLVAANTTLDPLLDMNKIIQVRAAGIAITVTLPNVDDIPVNSFIPIETDINNSKPTALTTTGGQYIYINNTSKNTIHMHPGEVCWLFRDEDGFYIINDFYNHYRNLCKPQSSYDVGDDEAICNGQEVLRADYPRVWEKAQTLGSSLVNEATWNTPVVYHKDGVFYTSPPTAPYRTLLNPYRSCFSSGNGTTTFRFPDLMNQFLRGLKSETGSDTERYLNKPGGRQLNENLAHAHEGKMGQGTGPLSVPDNVTPNPLNDGARFFITESSGGVESRPDNSGVYWTMKK